MNLKNCLLIFILACGCIAFGQGNQSRDTATVNKLLAEGKGLVGTDSAKAINLATRAKEMATGRFGFSPSVWAIAKCARSPSPAR